MKPRTDPPSTAYSTESHKHGQSYLGGFKLLAIMNKAAMIGTLESNEQRCHSTEPMVTVQPLFDPWSHVPICYFPGKCIFLQSDA